jgi:RimJ/RimL family protein N-acetyltransferase
MVSWFNETHLYGNRVHLIPLQQEHCTELIAAASDGKLWELWYTSVPSAETMQTYIDTALSEREKQQSLPFAVVETQTNTVIGTTRYCNVESQHKRLEIGYTWYAKSYQRTGVNTECKYLLLRHAFETLQAIAVEFRTHWHNHRSRNAISRLGAKQDGILRNHRVDVDGCFRDTVVFSIIEQEWLATKKSLEFALHK